MSRDRFTEDESVDILTSATRSAKDHTKSARMIAHVCSLVSIDDLQVGGMSADVVPVRLPKSVFDHPTPAQRICSDSLVRTSIPTQDIQKFPRVLKRLATIVTFHHADHLWVPRPCVLEPTEL
jgi:hypothetical protein